jgi:hypothetical protein
MDLTHSFVGGRLASCAQVLLDGLREHGGPRSCARSAGLGQRSPVTVFLRLEFESRPTASTKSRNSLRMMGFPSNEVNRALSANAAPYRILFYHHNGGRLLS